jgi:hypothetical protein
MFKYYVKGAMAGDAQKIKSPFLRLNIKCPSASYDPNVEPAKDDVLFENESYVLDSIEGLFKGLYGEPKPTSPKAKSRGQFSQKIDDFELLLARTSTTFPITTSEPITTRDEQMARLTRPSVYETSSNATPTSEPAKEQELAIMNAEDDQEIISGNKRKLGYDMFKDHSEEINRSSKLKQQNRASGPALSPISHSATQRADSLNPWLIAKMNVPVRKSTNEPLARIINNSNKRANANLGPFPTPENSSSPISPSPVVRRRSESEGRTRQKFHQDDIRELDLPSARPRSVQDNEQIPEPVYRRSQTAAPEDDMLLIGDDSETFRRGNGFVSARQAPAPDDNLSLLAALAPKAVRKQNRINKPFVPPPRTVENTASFENLRQTTITAGFSPVRRHDGDQAAPNKELAWAMDYENRKDDVTRRRRQELRAENLAANVAKGSAAVRSSPHRNRYNAAIATLENEDPVTKSAASLQESFKTTLPDEDPRGYLMRRQKSMLAKESKHGGPIKLSRAKSMRLPLETIPNQEQLHNLILSLPANMPSLGRAAKRLVEEDTYIDLGIRKAGLKMTPMEMTQVATRVEETVNKWLKAGSRKDHEVQFQFENLINL